MDVPESSKSPFLSPNAQIPTELYRRPSLERDGKSGKRGRASKPKVKSGCITCKTRRVKCDETKPQCIRCQKFGRVCDGYIPEQTQSRGLSNIRPRTPSAGLYNPSVSAYDTEDESRYFRLFAESTVFALSGFFEGTPSSQFWTQVVLQESHNLKAVRHAVIALGALTKGMENVPPGNFKVNVIQSLDQRHCEQAVVQHLKAIQALNHYISSSAAPQLRNALLTCLLFICFEVLQGGFLSPIEQIQGGLNMLRSYYSGQGGSRPLLPQQNASNSGNMSPSSTNVPTQTERKNSTNLSGVSHIRDYTNTTNIRHPEIGIQAPSPDRSMYDKPAYQVTDLKTVARYSPREYLNALPSNAPVAQQQASPYAQSANRAPDTVRSRSTSADSPSVSGSGPSSRSGSLNLSPTRMTKPQRQFLTTSGAPSPSLLQSDMKIEDLLVQAFVRLDAQCLIFNLPPNIPPLVWDIKKVHHILAPNVFSDFHTAHRCWDFLMDRAMRFYRQNVYDKSFSPGTSQPAASIAAELEFHRNQLMSFHNAFRPILDNAIQIDGVMKNTAAIVISLNQRYVAILLSVIAEDSEIVYENHFADFQHIVDTCRLLIETRNATQLPCMSRFSLDIGVIPPLYLVATKCRHSSLRREALELLFANPRQEGMWDSLLSAHIGKWLMSWEEEGLPVSSVAVSDSRMFGLHTSHTLRQQQPDSLNWSFDHQTPKIVDTMVDRLITMDVNAFSTSDASGGLSDHMLPTPNNMLSTSDNMHAQQQQQRRTRSPSTNNVFGVPEENRVRLTDVKFHISDRYMQVKGRKTMMNDDGTREEREAIIAW